MDESADEIKRTPRSIRNAFGAKKISLAGSFCLQLNNSMGATMVTLPLLYQAAGWLTPTLALIICFFLSSLAGTMLCEAMQRIPGNRNFEAEPRYEFATTVKHYYGHKAYILFQIFYNVSLQALNIVSMIVTAQAIDLFIYQICNCGFALDYTTFSFVEGCTTNKSADLQHCFSKGNIFPSDQVISLGYVVTMLICIPMGYINLEANMWFQWFSLGGLIVFTTEFVVQFLINAVPENGFDRTPVFHLAGQPTVLGVSVLSYAYIVTIPSWVNEKKAGVNINKAIWYPAIVGVALKIAVGLTGSWGFHLYNAGNDTAVTDADNILNFLLEPRMPWVHVVQFALTLTNFVFQWTRYSAYLWDITTLIPGIPVLAIMVRYNLQAGEVCGQKMAFFLGVVLPWIVTAFCYEYDVLVSICSWAGNGVSGFVNFVVPAILYYSALKRYPLQDNVEKFPKTTKPIINGKVIGSGPLDDTEPLLTPQYNNTAIQNGEFEYLVTSVVTPVVTPVVAPVQNSESYQTNRGYLSTGELLCVSQQQSVDSNLNDVKEHGEVSQVADTELPDFIDTEPLANAVPSWIPVNPKKIALTLTVTFTVLAVAYIFIMVTAALLGDQY